MQPIHIIGGGLAGCEAAWQIALRGVPVVIHEMRPGRMSEAHKTAHLAELVCSNSFRSDDAQTNAVGLLHEEMRRLGSLILRAGDANQVPAGGALAVDRDGFASAVTSAVTANPLVDIRSEAVKTPSRSSTPSHRSSSATPSTCRLPGSSRATTRRARAAPVPTTSTA